MSDELESHFKHGTLCIGIVVANEDPEGLGRIRVEVPGLIEPSSPWAFPIGGSGGGAETSGWFDVPPLNAMVGILFNGGEIDHPYYLGGWHGKGEVPAYLSGVSLADRVKVKVYETKLFHMVFDDRDSTKTFLIKNKSTGDYISIADGETKIKAATKVTVEAPHVVVNSMNVELGGAGPMVALTDGVVLASGVDTFTGATYGVLGSASALVKAKKI